jgi:hypothetical protein
LLGFGPLACPPTTGHGGHPGLFLLTFCRLPAPALEYRYAHVRWSFYSPNPQFLSCHPFPFRLSITRPVPRHAPSGRPNAQRPAPSAAQRPAPQTQDAPHTQQCSCCHHSALVRLGAGWSWPSAFSRLQGPGQARFGFCALLSSLDQIQVPSAKRAAVLSRWRTCRSRNPALGPAGRLQRRTDYLPPSGP